jgi:outer membrane receptor for ferrienterochelin and colicin
LLQHLFPNTDHQIRTGISFVSDNYDERVFENSYLRNENVFGVYGEYTYNNIENWTVVAGLRGDVHSNFGFFLTPRLNVRYLINDLSVARIAAGKGYRTANIFADNIGAFASNRIWEIEGENPDTPYGLEQEEAWNIGVNYSQEFVFVNRSVLFSMDAFHTRFINQIVVDYDFSPGHVYAYNLDGESYSNSVQVQFDLSLIENLDIRTAYRFNDVKATQKEGLVQKPLVSRHRAFLNMAYEFPGSWKLDATLNWQDVKRIPQKFESTDINKFDVYSPSFFLLNGQVSKSWGRSLEIYFGGENLLNFRQDNPIISAENPFDESFDASLIWGPVFGRNLYVGVRYKLFGAS